eukprot:3398211-Rhodomonas_salina.1
MYNPLLRRNICLCTLPRHELTPSCTRLVLPARLQSAKQERARDIERHFKARLYELEDKARQSGVYLPMALRVAESDCTGRNGGNSSDTTRTHDRA